MSFEYVERFLDQAVKDDHVTHIKISLYRVADNSPLTSSLLEALEKGKEVTVFVEAKARFDEESNLALAKQLHYAGVLVLYGIIGYKIVLQFTVSVRKKKTKTQIFYFLYKNCKTFKNVIQINY